MEQMQEFETEARNDLIEGRNAVIEALRAGRTMRYRDGALEEVSGAC